MLTLDDLLARFNYVAWHHPDALRKTIILATPEDRANGAGPNEYVDTGRYVLGMFMDFGGNVILTISNPE